MLKTLFTILFISGILFFGTLNSHELAHEMAHELSAREWAMTLTTEPFANEMPPDYSVFRQARDEITMVLFGKIQRYGSDYFFGSDHNINKLVLVSALDDAMKTVNHSIMYQIKIGKVEFPAFALSADVFVTYQDDISEISWVYTVKIVPGLTPIFYRERIEAAKPETETLYSGRRYAISR